MKPITFVFTCALSLAALSFASTASALAIRCDSYVIDVGMHKAEVLQKCGVPGLQERRVERRIVRERQAAGNYAYTPTANRQTLGNMPAQGLEIEREIEIVRDEWVYNFGPNQFMQLLVFEDGRLKEIRSLDYGK